MSIPSRLRVDELQTLDDSVMIPVANIASKQYVEDFSQSFEDLINEKADLDSVVLKGEMEGEQLVSASGSQTLSAAINQRVVVFLTVSAMQAAANLTPGVVVSTIGYYAPMDGGACSYRIVDQGTGTADGGSFINLAGSNLQAQAIFNGYLNIKQFGARGDGVTNDSAAVRAAAVYAHANQITEIRVPRAAVSYRVANVDLTDTPGLSFVGDSYPRYSAFTAAAVEGESTFHMHSSGSYFFLMPSEAFMTFRGMLFYGKSKANTGWLGNGTKVIRIHADTCGWYNLGDAVGTNGYIGESKFFGCTYCDNEYGIKNVVDCQFLGGYVVSNNWGVNLAAGANDNTFTGMKIEFNQRNVECFQSVHNSMDNVILDRAGFKNIRAIDSEMSFTGGTIRRAGYDETTGTKAHLEVGGNTTLSFTGTFFQSGNGSDDGSGTVGPDYLLNYIDTDNNPHVTFIGGRGPGSTVGTINNPGTAVTRFVAVRGIADA